jgi:hypothetical protein
MLLLLLLLLLLLPLPSPLTANPGRAGGGAAQPVLRTPGDCMLRGVGVCASVLQAVSGKCG